MIGSTVVALHFPLPSPMNTLVLGLVPWTYISTCGISGGFGIPGNVYKIGVYVNLGIFLKRGTHSVTRIAKRL